MAAKTREHFIGFDKMYQNITYKYKGVTGMLRHPYRPDGEKPNARIIKMYITYTTNGPDTATKNNLSSKLDYFVIYITKTVQL